MRLFLLTLAVFTALATVGSSPSAKGQTSLEKVEANELNDDLADRSSPIVHPSEMPNSREEAVSAPDSALYGNYLAPQASEGDSRRETQAPSQVIVKTVAAGHTAPVPPETAEASRDGFVTRSAREPKEAQAPTTRRSEVAVQTAPINATSVSVAAPQTVPSPRTDYAQTPETSPTQEAPQTTPTDPTPVIPAPGEESTPQQETPDRIEFDVTPAPAGTQEFNAPQPLPGGQPEPTQENPQPAVEGPEARVLVAEVLVNSVGDPLPEELLNEVYRTLRTQPGRTATRSQLQEDVNAIYETGYFAKVDVVPEDTPLGVRVTYVVQPNPVLRSVAVTSVPANAQTRALPQEVIDETFRDQYGRILNLRAFQEGIKRLNEWYKKNGYDLAQVIATPQIAADGNVQLEVAEGIIEDIQVRFLNKEGEENDEEGQPIDGRTRDFIITRELALKSGDVFNRTRAEQDLRRVYRLGIFEDVRLSFTPGQDPRQVVVVVDVIEKNTGSVAAGAGISSASGLFGTISYQEQNLGGNNQKLGAELQVGQRELLFDVNFTDPWIAGDPYRTSYTVNAFRRRSISLIFDGGEDEIELPNGDRPRIVRTGGGISFTRPLSKNPLADSEWRASLGLQYQNVSVRDSDGDLSPEDERGNDLSFSGEGKDDLLTVQLGAVRDRRNNPITPTAGSLLRFGVEQSVPIGNGSILLNRLRGSYSFYIPVKYTNFSEGPQALAFNIQAGTVLGDLPPYEAFSLGGSNSVRGYEEGDVGSGRSFIQATAEYRFPIFSVVGGALFVDVATDLGSGETVPGDPAGERGKPGSGIGFGVGVRVQSPLGPIRIDYGLNDDGDSRIHFGIGERF